MLVAPAMVMVAGAGGKRAAWSQPLVTGVSRKSRRVRRIETAEGNDLQECIHSALATYEGKNDNCCSYDCTVDGENIEAVRTQV